MYLRRSLCLVAALFCAVSFTPAADKAAEEKGFVSLGNGKDMSLFALKGPAKTWSVEGKVIKCAGKPNGYFRTKKSYRNYILRLDFRYPQKAGNSGYLLHINGQDKIWPNCIEVQGQYAGVCSIFPIGGAKGPRPKADGQARKKAAKPHQEWNSVEIISRDGAFTAKLNGTTISRSEPYTLKEGSIGFQSEGAEIHFRNIRIKVID